MESFQIETSHNVKLNYELASLGDRIVARILDYLVQMGYGIVMFFIFAFVAGFFSEYDLDEFNSSASYIIVFIMALPIIFYHLIFEIMTEGQTPGKKQRNIKVVSLGGEPVSLGSYILRWLLGPLDTFFYGVIGIISIALSDNNQRVGDMLAKTTVVKASRKVTLDHTIRPRLIKEGYQPVFPGVQMLSSKDIELIKKVLNTEAYRNNNKMITQLADKVRSKIQAGEDYSDLRLLFTVIKDFNYYKV